MNHSLGRLISAIVAAMIVGALGFGAVQASASPSAPTSSRSCDLKACFAWCQQVYGEGATPYCNQWGGCGCIR